MRSAQILNRIEPAEHGEVLPHREPHRHVDIGAFEIHPAQHLGALLRHRMPQHLDAARGRQHQPHDHGDGRGLAGAVAAQQAGDAAARDAERDVVDRAGGLVEFDECATSIAAVRRIRRGRLPERGRFVDRHASRSLGYRGGKRKKDVDGRCHGGAKRKFVIAPRCAAKLIGMTDVAASDFRHPRRYVRLDTILRLRWLAALGQLAAIFIVAQGLEFDVPVMPCVAIVGLSAAAQSRAADRVQSDAAAGAGLCGGAAGAQHRRTGRALVLHRRAAEPVLVPVPRARF